MVEGRGTRAGLAGPDARGVRVRDVTDGDGRDGRDGRKWTQMDEDGHGYGMQDAGCRMQDAGYRMQDTGCKIQDARYCFRLVS